MGLDEFLRRFTSEDNASFELISREKRAQMRKKLSWVYNQSKDFNQINELASQISERDKLKMLIYREEQNQKEKDEIKLRTIPALEFTKSDPKSALFFMKTGKNWLIKN